ncbi:alpha/beta fold hydrolase [Herbaspirillum sp. RV1423]|uniref:alpha/beta fold hydrolase n=1 Tax=Herbaspirillum sp. RV1423 TaxID=1443993 RepID=UPI0004BCA3E9|nr:alpha/beta hydrolase [Herbaspirillum sp. RV1423]
MNARQFALPVDDETIAVDTLGSAEQLSALFLHGAGQSHRQRQRLLREELAEQGFGSIAFDFSGHGDSSANSPGSLQKRLREAEHVLQATNVAHAVHTVVGTSMSGEIAIRLACKPDSELTHLVMIVGAIYDRAAFALPFGPAFSAAIRRPQSWREAETLEFIRHYRGGLSIIRALDDAVIPHDVAELLVQAAQSARFRRLIDLPDTDHRLSEKMVQDALLRQRIAAIIRQENQEEK